MKLAIIGAAGVRTPLIVKECYKQAESLGLKALSLFDINKERLENIERVSQSIFENDDQVLKRSLTTNIENALEGADYVITTFRVGGMEGRVIDERVPLSLGVLGQETTGAGGFAMGVRSIPVLLQYTKLMRKYCPEAWLINFANPSGMLAEAAISTGGWKKTIGICDAPTEVQRVVSTMLNVPRDEIYVDYFGLNHLGWTRAIKWHGKDILPGLIKDIDTLPIKNLLPFSPELIQSLGMIPNEYLYYYYYSKAAVQNILQAKHTRGEEILEANDRLFAQIELNKENPVALKDIYTEYLEQRRAHYMQNETGGASNSALEPITLELQGGYADVALQLIRSLQKGEHRIHIVNTLNQGAVDGLPDDCVVEVPCVVGRDLVQPCNVGQIPLQCLGLMARVKAYEQLTIQAAVEGSSRKAIEALTIHPLVADEKISSEIVNKFKQQFGNTFLAGAK